MNLLKRTLEKLNGLHYPQEYLCLANETFQQGLHLHLVQNRQFIKDVTHLHSFVGYCPVVFVFPAFEEIANRQMIEIFFKHEKQTVASLRLKRIKTQTTEAGEIFYYQGAKGKHRFISPFHQILAQLYNRLYNKKLGNVFLKGNLYSQVQIAYSLTRKICLITVGINAQYNLFPTDLHGQVNEQYYVISLRHAGKACEQVVETKKIVLSDMKASAYKKVYSLGKNHMQPLKAASDFHFSPISSEQFQLPLPKEIVAYKELQLQDSFNAGIHKLLLFKIINGQEIDEAPQTLVHIHNTYATWLYKKGRAGNYLLR